MYRRDFLKRTGLAIGGVALFGSILTDRFLPDSYVDQLVPIAKFQFAAIHSQAQD